MANYDKDTQDFMESVNKKDELKKKAPQLIKSTINLARNVVAHRPDNVARNLTSIAIQLKKPEHEKQAGSVHPETVLKFYSLLNTKFDKDWHDWEPETLWTELEHAGVMVTDEIRNAVMAMQVAMNTNTPFEEWHIFENTAHAFAGNDVNFSIIQPLEMTEVAACMKILRRIRPREDFSDEVCGYIASCAMNAGMVYLPDDLFQGACQSSLDSLMFTHDLKDQVKATWPRVIPGEDSLAIQLQRLQEVKAYVEQEA